VASFVSGEIPSLENWTVLENDRCNGRTSNYRTSWRRSLIAYQYSSVILRLFLRIKATFMKVANTSNGGNDRGRYEGRWTNMVGQGNGDSTTKKILVVDDEESLADMLATALRFAGYEVGSEPTGLDALRAIKDTSPDLVILDVNLPDIDGFEVCRRIRNDGFRSPVIFLTARDSTDDLRTGFGGGGDDYLTKPFSLEELTLRIEAILRRTQSDEADNQLTCANLRLDEDMHQVFVDDSEVELSPTEFKLLRYLMLNQGHVLSKTQILDYVWEYDFEGNDAVVETYVSYLRKKLGSEASELIRTVRGTGYVLRSTDS